MKQFIALAFILSTIASSAQDTAYSHAPETQLGKINLKVGTIIKKEFVDLYKLTPKGFLNTENLSIQLLTMWDAATDTRLSGLYFSTTDAGTRYTLAQSYTAYIDADEVPALIRFLQAIDKVEAQEPVNYTEYLFNSRDLRWYAYYSRNAKGKGSWNYGLYLDKFYKGSIVLLKKEDLAPILNKLIKALPLLNTTSAELPETKSDLQ